ncbi:hypothetical protein TNCV_3091131 [Trichonephila clavipes]|uniref:Uncharacterized protein n=1 Tax=Trichonephila clavipes TaxID=2585209 RepID=A0A8X6W9S2_TRICX|nr:hypothetical protein TNCV_3091131 [Trichonephila clavipes]
MTGERLQENNSSVMDKCPDAQMIVWCRVIQDGQESAIVSGDGTETRAERKKEEGENVLSLLEDLVMRRKRVEPTPSRGTTTRRLHYECPSISLNFYGEKKKSPERCLYPENDNSLKNQSQSLTRLHTRLLSQSRDEVGNCFGSRADRGSGRY